jgi:hypothetical protein
MVLVPAVVEVRLQLPVGATLEQLAPVPSVTVTVPVPPGATADDTV